MDPTTYAIKAQQKAAAAEKGGGGADDDILEIPIDFICPITSQVLMDPVITGAGFNFERQAILECLEDAPICPVTLQPLTEEDLLENHRLKVRIAIWRDQKGIPAEKRISAKRHMVRSGSQLLRMTDSDFEHLTGSPASARKLLSTRKSSKSLLGGSSRSLSSSSNLRSSGNSKSLRSSGRSSNLNASMASLNYNVDENEISKPPKTPKTPKTPATPRKKGLKHHAGLANALLQKMALSPTKKSSRRTDNNSPRA